MAIGIMPVNRQLLEKVSKVLRVGDLAPVIAVDLRRSPVDSPLMVLGLVDDIDTPDS